MKRLELVIVQFEEVKRLIEIGRVPHLRLAFILLDSVVELVMHRMAQSELELERFSFQMLENYRRAEAAGRGNDRIRAEIKDLEKKVTSKSKRKNIDRIFVDKVDFLVERGRLLVELGPALKRLHEYRNETYHRDQHRIEVIRPAVLIYFDVACTVLSSLRPRSLSIEPVGPEVGRFQEAGSAYYAFDLPARAARQLRDEVGLDLDVIRTALREHLLERLRELEESLVFVEEFLNDVVPGDGLRAVQVEDNDMEAALNRDVMRSRTYPHSGNDLVAWRERAEALVGIVEKYALFAEFAAIETSFEWLEHRALMAVMQIDEGIQLQLDMRRGK